MEKYHQLYKPTESRMGVKIFVRFERLGKLRRAEREEHVESRGHFQIKLPETAECKKKLPVRMRVRNGSHARAKRTNRHFNEGPISEVPSVFFRLTTYKKCGVGYGRDKYKQRVGQRKV